jgi:uncharacterized protein YjdB
MWATKGGLAGAVTIPISVYDPAEPVFTITATIEYDAPALSVGFPAALAVTSAPVPSEPVISVKSSNPAVVTYNEDGTLNLLSTGTATLEVTMTSRGRSATATIPVIIMDTPPQTGDSYTDVYIQLGDDPDTDFVALTDAAPLASLKCQLYYFRQIVSVV